MDQRKQPEMSAQPLLELEHYRLISTRFEALAAEDSSELTDEGKIQYGVARHEDDPRRLAVQIQVKVKKLDEEGGFQLTMELQGLFRYMGPFAPGEALGEEELPKQVLINSLAILWGTARGLIGTVTGWAGERYLLPTVHFPAIVDSVEGTSEAES